MSKDRGTSGIASPLEVAMNRQRFFMARTCVGASPIICLHMGQVYSGAMDGAVLPLILYNHSFRQARQNVCPQACRLQERKQVVRKGNADSGAAGPADTRKELTRTGTTFYWCRCHSSSNSVLNPRKVEVKQVLVAAL